MAHPQMVDVYVRELLLDAFDGEVDSDGPRYRLPLAARPVVEVVPAGGPGLRVQVAAPVARTVAAGPELLAAVNDTNGRLPYGRMFAIDGTVIMEHTVLGDSVDRAQLDNAIDLVVWAVEQFGVEIATAGGGTPAVTDDATAGAGDPVSGSAPRGPNATARTGASDATGLQTGAPVGSGPDVPSVNAAGYL